MIGSILRKPTTRTGAALACAFASLAFTTTIAGADTSYPTRIVAVPNAPVTLTHCESAMGFYLRAIDNATNRTDAFLSSYTVRWTVYDHTGTVVGQSDLVNTFDTDLAPGDETHSKGDAVNWSGPSSAVASVTCRLQAAKFEGGKTWTYGRTWPGKLAPIQQMQSYQDGGSTVSGLGSTANVPASHPQVKLAVSNAWNDMVQGALFVHAALDIQGGSTDANLTPNMLMLTMQLSNGAKKSYGAMTQAAPTYQKLNPLGQTTQTAYEVDPKDDLGAIGSIIVPAHGTVHVIATFFVGTDVVADPTSNRQVALQ